VIPLFLGSFLTAAAQPLYLNSPSQLASQWFGANEIAFATVIGNLAFPLGALVGFVFPSFMIPSDSTSKTTQQLYDLYVRYMIVVNMVLSLMALPGVFFIKEKPITPPS
jgi:hypothetical protein